MIDKDTLVIDLETLGVEGDMRIITCIGMKGNGEETEVLFADTPGDEPKLIMRLKERLKRTKRLVLWKGTKMDIPFLKTRCLLLGIDISELKNIEILDLNDVIENELTLSQVRFRDVRTLLGIERTDNYDGRDMPMFYNEWMNGNKKRKGDIINHCKDDVENTATLFEKFQEVGLV
jgi:uncharacterized protein YprB with RNaseH-like and TPR domain